LNSWAQVSTIDRDAPPDEGARAPYITALSILVGGHPFLIDTIYIREIRGWSPPSPFPGCPPWIEGVCDLRGTVIPVISMVTRLGLEPAGVAPTVTVVIEVQGRLLGVAVDAVSDLVSIPSERLQPTPAAGGAPARALLSAVVELDGRVFGVVDFEQLVIVGPAALAAACQAGGGLDA
jgi:purine-binding chemotaxis protein CheW